MVSERENKEHTLQSYQFLINPSAGHGYYDQTIRNIHSVLSDLNLQYDIKVLQYKGEATSISREASETHDVVVAVGGDGTINEVCNGLLGTQTILGIVPVGTGNGFARSLGLPLSTEEACQVLVTGEVKGIDMGMVNGRYFLGTSGIGFDAMISRFVNERLGWFRGMWLYFVAGAYTFFKCPPRSVSVEVDDRTVEVSPLLIAVANTGLYGGKAMIAPDAKPDDGLFDVCVIQRMNALQLLWNLPKLFNGRHINLRYVNMYKAKHVIVNSKKPVPVHVDGEAMDSHSRLEFKLIPNAIRIMVPRRNNV